MLFKLFYCWYSSRSCEQNSYPGVWYYNHLIYHHMVTQTLIVVQHCCWLSKFNYNFFFQIVQVLYITYSRGTRQLISQLTATRNRKHTINNNRLLPLVTHFIVSHQIWQTKINWKHSYTAVLAIIYLTTSSVHSAQKSIFVPVHGSQCKNQVLKIRKIT